LNSANQQYVINKQVILIKKEYLTFFILFIVTIMAQASEGYRIELLNNLAIGIILFYSLTADEETILYMLMYLMPANKLFGIGGLSVNLLILLIFFLKGFIFNKSKVSKKFVFLSLLFFLYTIMYVWQYHSYQEVLQSIKTFIVLFFCLSMFNSEKYDLGRLYKYSVVFLALGIVSNFLIAMVVNPAIFDVRRLVVSSDSNPNTLAIIISYALAQVVILLNSKHIKNPKGIIILSVVLCLIGLYTQSRTFVANFVIISLWLLLPWFKTPFYKILKRTLIVTLIFAGFFLLFNSSFQISDQLQIVIDRIIAPSRGDITSGRVEIWSQYIAALKYNPSVLLFGIGMDYTKLGIYMMAHNMWIEQITSFGLTGTLLVIILYISAAKTIVIKNISKYKYAGTFNLLPIVVILASGMFSHSFMALNVTIQLFFGVATLFLKPRQLNKVL
jgi:hypothetical protein